MPGKVEQVAANVKKAMEHTEDWEKRPTNIRGIYLVKMPDKGLKVMLMFNPPDENGNPRKKRGFYFDDIDTVRAAAKAFPDRNLETLVEAIAKVNQKSGSKAPDAGEVFEV